MLTSQPVQMFIASFDTTARQLTYACLICGTRESATAAGVTAARKLLSDHLFSCRAGEVYTRMTGLWSEDGWPHQAVAERSAHTFVIGAGEEPLETP